MLENIRERYEAIEQRYHQLTFFRDKPTAPASDAGVEIRQALSMLLREMKSYIDLLIDPTVQIHQELRNAQTRVSALERQLEQERKDARERLDKLDFHTRPESAT